MVHRSGFMPMNEEAIVGDILDGLVIQGSTIYISDPFDANGEPVTVVLARGKKAVSDVRIAVLGVM